MTICGFQLSFTYYTWYKTIAYELYGFNLPLVAGH